MKKLLITIFGLSSVLYGFSQAQPQMDTLLFHNGEKVPIFFISETDLSYMVSDNPDGADSQYVAKKLVKELIIVGEDDADATSQNATVLANNSTNNRYIYDAGVALTKAGKAYNVRTILYLGAVAMPIAAALTDQYVLAPVSLLFVVGGFVSGIVGDVQVGRAGKELMKNSKISYQLNGTGASVAYNF